METQKFSRKPFEIEAVQVTHENVQEVAAWCDGVIQYDDVDHSKFFIKVKVHHPLTPRQTTAYVGDWVLYSKSGFKVYVDGAFRKNFIPTEQESDAAVTVLKNIFTGSDDDLQELRTVSPKDAISGKK